MLADYDDKICFEDRAEFHPSWPYSFVFEIRAQVKLETNLKGKYDQLHLYCIQCTIVDFF